MPVTVRILQVTAPRQGLFEITDLIREQLNTDPPRQGICTIFLQHTSASLLVQENADPSAKRDLETWLNRLVPENDSLYRHTSEGPDDMPAHIKTALTQVSISIPIDQGNLLLGTWQGIYLWEHRRMPTARKIALAIYS